MPGLPDLSEVLGRVELPELRPFEPGSTFGADSLASGWTPEPVPPIAAEPDAAPDAEATAPDALAPAAAVLPDVKAAADLLFRGDVAGALGAIQAEQDEIEAAVAGVRADPAHTTGAVASRLAEAARSDPRTAQLADQLRQAGRDPRLAAVVSAVGAQLDVAQRQKLARLGQGLQQHAANLLDGEITSADLRGALDGVRDAARDGGRVLSPAARVAVGQKAGAVAAGAARRGAGCFGIVLAIFFVIGLIVWGATLASRSEVDTGQPVIDEPADPDPVASPTSTPTPTPETTPTAKPTIKPTGKPTAKPAPGPTGESVRGEQPATPADPALFAEVDRAARPKGGIPFELNVVDPIEPALAGAWTVDYDDGEGYVEYVSDDHPDCYVSLTSDDMREYGWEPAPDDSDASQTAATIGGDLSVVSIYVPYEGGGSVELRLDVEDETTAVAQRTMPKPGIDLYAYATCYGDEKPQDVLIDSLRLAARK